MGVTVAAARKHMPYHFRPFTRADVPMVALWLQTPEVVRWWGEPEAQLALIIEDLDEPSMRQWIVEHDGLPFAYVQAYRAQAWPEPHLSHLPSGAEAIDAFVGVPDMIGRGHGGAFLRMFAEMLTANGAAAVVIDPDARNHRARRAYACAGFVGDEVVDTDDGPVVLMLFKPDQPAGGTLPYRRRRWPSE
jgi:aminoglycoside 6'-N-acetyltransferase